MSLLDRLIRRRPDWEHPDPAVRAEAARHVPAQEQELLERLASSDSDPRVRRAAVKRLKSPAALGAAAADGDAGVREEAASALVAIAMGEDAPAAEAALGAIGEARHLGGVARSAPLPAIRRSALARIRDERGLALIARTASDPAVRSQALSAVHDGRLRLEVAVRSEHKDVAVAAVEGLEDVDALERVAARARHRAAARRARARLDALRGPSPATAAGDAASAGQHAQTEDVEELRNETEPEDMPAASEPEPAPTEPEPAGTETVPVTIDAVAAREPAPTDAAMAETPSPLAAEGFPDAEDARTAEAPGVEPPSGMVPAPDETVPAPDDTASGATIAPPAAAPPAAAPPPARDLAAERRAEEEKRVRAGARIEQVSARMETVLAGAEVALRDAEAALRAARSAQDLVILVPPRLKERFRATRARLYARTQELREADEWRRWGNATVQEELCARMEALTGREDLDALAREFRDLDLRWAEAKEVPRDQADALRRRYQAARAPVRARLDEHFARKAAEEAANLARKADLCARAEALADSTDWLRTAEQLKALQAEWKTIGPVPRRQGDALWKRFRAACDRFFTRRQEDLKGRKQEWSRNLARKEELCGRAETLADSTDWEAAAGEVRRLQSEWKTVGPVQRKKSEEVWQRFRRACDAFFDRYKRRDELTRSARRAEREAVVAELEALVPAGEGGTPPEGLAARLQELQARARQIPLAGADDEALNRRLGDARNRLIAAWPEAFRGTELDPDVNRSRREKLLARVEALAAQAPPADEPLHGEALARRLKEALATNTIGGADAEAQRRAAAREVDAAREAWARLGPVPGEAGARLEERFRIACARVSAQAPRAAREPRRHAPAR